MSNESNTQEQPEMTDYEVRVGCIHLPSNSNFVSDSNRLMPGDRIPEGLLTERDMESLLREKRIARVRPSERTKERAPKHKGKWNLDPATLQGLAHEDLLVRVQEIDPLYPLDGLDDEAACIALLSSEFEEAFNGDPADVLGSDPVSRMGTEGVRDGGSGRMSDDAAARLAELQQRAQTEDAAGGADQDDESGADGSDDLDGDAEPQG